MAHGEKKTKMSLKNWYKTVTKATNEQLQWAKDAIAGKTSPVPNDPLGDERMDIDSYNRVLQSLQANAQHSIKILEAFRNQEPESVTLGLAVTNGPYTNGLKKSVSAYTRRHSRLLHHIDEHVGTLQQTIHEIKNKLTVLAAVQKKYEVRDRQYQKVEEDERRWQRALEQGDAKVIEKRVKHEKAHEDFHQHTVELKADAKDILSDSAAFIDSLFSTLHNQERDFYGELARIFCDSDEISLGGESFSGGNLRSSIETPILQQLQQYEQAISPQSSMVMPTNGSSNQSPPLPSVSNKDDRRRTPSELLSSPRTLSYGPARPTSEVNNFGYDDDDDALKACDIDLM